jgi:hypothetical protein
MRSIDLVVHLARERSGRRFVREIAAVDGDDVREIWRSPSGAPGRLPGPIAERLA